MHSNNKGLTACVARHHETRLTAAAIVTLPPPAKMAWATSFCRLPSEATQVGRALVI